jgi:hypothetical protein
MHNNVDLTVHTGVLLAGISCDVNGVSIDDEVTHATHITMAEYSSPQHWGHSQRGGGGAYTSDKQRSLQVQTVRFSCNKTYLRKARCYLQMRNTEYEGKGITQRTDEEGTRNAHNLS